MSATWKRQLLRKTLVSQRIGYDTTMPYLVHSAVLSLACLVSCVSGPCFYRQAVASSQMGNATAGDNRNEAVAVSIFTSSLSI